MFLNYMQLPSYIDYVKCIQILRIYKLNFAFIIIEIFINIITTIIFYFINN